jgi:uncharacterized protein (DUF58 family)
MSNGHDLPLSELIALRSSVRGLSFDHRQKANATLGGAYYSQFRGRGMDFDEVRLYQPGDDLRHLDWRVTARRQLPHTKVFREERERPIYLLVDLRSTMYFGTRVAFKSVVAAKIAALLSWAAVESGDRVGAVLVGSEGPVILRAQARQKGALVILQQLAEFSMKQPTHYESDTLPLLESFRTLQKVVRPNGLVFIISDFQGIHVSDLSILQSVVDKQQLMSIMVYDALEEKLPTEGVYTFANHDDRINIRSSATLTQRYSEQFQNKLSTFRQWHHQHGAQWNIIRTDHDIVKTLRRMLHSNKFSHTEHSERAV